MQLPLLTSTVNAIAKSIVAKLMGLIVLVSFLVLLTLLLSDLFIYRSNERLSAIVDTKVEEISVNARVSAELHQTFLSVHFLLNDFLSKDIQWQELRLNLEERLQKSIDIESGHDVVIQSYLQRYLRELDRLLEQCRIVSEDFKGLRLLDDKIMGVLLKLDQFIVDRQLAMESVSPEEEIAFNQFAIMVPALLEIFFEIKLKTQHISMIFLQDIPQENQERALSLRLINELRTGLEAVTASWPEAQSARNSLIALMARYDSSLRQLYLGLDSLVSLRDALMASENKVLEDLSVMSKDIAFQADLIRGETLRLAGVSFKVSLFATVIIFLLLAIIAVIIIRIVSPIKALTNGVLKVARGEVDSKVEIHSNDEIGQLAVAFNTMTDMLKRTTISRDLVEDMVNSLDELLIVTDENGIIVSANSAAYKVIGFKEEDLLGMSIVDALKSRAITQKNGSGLPEGQLFYEQVRLGRLSRLELCCIKGVLGKRHFLFSAGLMIGESAGQGSIVCILADISDRVLAEARLLENERKYRELFEHDQAALMVIDAQTKQFEDVNRASLTLFGYTKEDFLKLTVMDISAEKEETKKRFAQIASGHGEIATITQRLFIKADGSKFIGEITPFSFLSDGRTKVVGAVRDLTEKIRLDKQLHQSQKMEAVGTLAGGIAHDFNNILGAIIGFTELAKEDCPSDSPLADDLQEIFKASLRAKGLVQQILAFSRQTDTERIPMDPVAIAGEVAGLIRSTIPATIEIEERIETEVGLVYANPTQVHQILMNLCTNSFHAMEETGGVLKILLKKRQLRKEDLEESHNLSPGDYVQFSICDSGAGIPVDIQEKIFDPFFTTKETDRGTGMGLSVVHGLVQGNGGFLTLESETGKGTSVHVFLPASDEVVIAGGDLEAERVPGGREHILFVDDEPMIVKIGKSMLERLGYHVTARTSSAEALDTFRKQPESYDLVITDQTMPGMTGADLAGQLLAIQPTIPIIICTGYSSVLSPEKALASGIRKFVPKPFSTKDLAVAIRQCLDDEV